MSNQETLTRRSFVALRWGYFGNVLRAVIQFSTAILLARLLDPAAFGLFSASMIMISFARLVTDLGLSASIVQFREMPDQKLAFVFTMHCAIGASFFILTFCNADFFAENFGAPETKNVIQAISIVFLLQALSQAQTAILQRQMRYGAIQVAAISSYFVGYAIVGASLAHLGYGVWSLVAAQITQSTTYTIVVWRVSSARPRFTLELRNGVRQLIFGSKVTIANLSSWAFGNVPQLLIGHITDPTALGLYSRSVALLELPIGSLVSALQPVLLSAGSRARQDTDAVGRSFVSITGFLGLALLPFLTTVALVPEAVILGLYGPKWVDAVPLLPPLAAALAINALLALVGPILTALDKVKSEITAQTTSLAITIPFIAYALQFSIEMGVWMLAGCFSLRYLMLLFMLSKAIRIRWAQFARVQLSSLLFSIAVAVPIYFLDDLLPLEHGAVRLTALVASAAVLKVALLSVLGPLIFSNHQKTLMRSAGIPHMVMKILRIN